MKKSKQKIKVNSEGCKSDIGKIATIRHLTRIITYLSEVGCDYQKNIERKTGITSQTLKSAVTFLFNYKIIFILKRKNIRSNSGVKFYALNPFFIR